MTDADKLKAAFTFIRQIGADKVGLRSSDTEEPIIWIVLAEFKDRKNPLYLGKDSVEVDASLSPLKAALRLCERLADGTVCSYCNRRIAFDPTSFGQRPYDNMLCWTQYDPEMKVFRRSCE